MKPTRHLFITALTLAALTAGAWAQTTKAAQPARKNKPVAAAQTQPGVTVADVQSLKDAIAAQQQQIQQLTQQLQQNQQAWQQAQQQVQLAQSTAVDAQQRAATVQATANQQQSTVAKLSSDVADVKTSSVVAGQDEQKRVSVLESAFGRFRFTGDMRIRGESYFQGGVPDRNRARIRARFGIDGQLGENFVGGIHVAGGSLGDPSTTNETLTNFFDRKTIGIDRGYITYNPIAHKWLSLTGGKFAYPWQRTSLTFDPDINPEGFDAKFSLDTHRGPIRNFTIQGMELLINEVKAGADSYITGGNISSKLEFGPWTLTPSYTLLNVHGADANLNASAFAVQSSATGVNSTGTNNGNVPGEGPGCATIQNVPSPAGLSFPPCAFSPNGMTNSTYVTVDSKGNPTAHFLSRFLYSDFILNNRVKTGIERLPLNLVLEYEENLNAATNPFDTKGNATTLGKQNKAYGLDFSVGQVQKKNDVQFGYSWWRIEQDAIIASWAESDQRAPTNILQNRIYGMWKMQRNVTAQYTMWLGRTLNTNLENNAASVGKTISTAGTKESTLKRQQIDLIYTF